MKKFSLSAAVVAVLLVAASAFNKPDPVPSQGRIGNDPVTGAPILVDMTDDGFCTTDDKPCLYDDQGNPIPSTPTDPNLGVYHP